MSRRITAPQFAPVPALLGLPPIDRPPLSPSSVPSWRWPSFQCGTRIDLSEGCMVTKAVNYTNRLTHWVSASLDKSDNPDEILPYLLSRVLCIVPEDVEFTLDHPCNLVYLEMSVRASLDLYAFIAVTASSSTLDDLLKVVQAENDSRQQTADETGQQPPRRLDFSLPCITNPEFELVALHPEHFLPGRAMHIVYGPGRGEYKDYYTSQDRCLRESPDPSSPRLPPFRHDQSNRSEKDRLNIFLVIMNADLKFRFYFDMVREQPPSTPLPEDVLNLMHRTIDLVNRIYWVPTPREGTKGYELQRQANQRRMEEKQSPQAPLVNTGPSHDDNAARPTVPTSARLHAETKWLWDVNIETRKAYCSALIGRETDYHPSLLYDCAC